MGERFREAAGFRIAVWSVLGGLLAVFALAVAAGVLLPRFVQLEAVKSRILAVISERLDARIEAAGLDLAFFPVPRAALRRVKVDFSGGASAAADLLAVRPELLPLLRGTFAVGAVEMEGLDASIRIPQGPFSSFLKEGSFPLERIEDVVQQAMDAARRFAPGVTVTVRRGRVALSDGKSVRFLFEGLEARAQIPPKRLLLEASFSANTAARIAVRASLDPGTWRGEARVSVSRLRPEPILSYLKNRPVGAVELPEITGAATLGFEGRGNVSAGFEATAPTLGWRPARDILSFSEVRLRAGARFSGGAFQATLYGVSARQPDLSATGAFSWIPASSQASAELKVEKVDLGLLRSAALRLFPTVRGVRQACDVVRGGRAKGVRLRSRATSPAGLTAMDGVEIDASAEDASLHIPGTELQVVRGAGQVAIARRSLSAWNLTGKTRGGMARGGTLRLGFTGPDAPFHLDLDLTADLQRLAEILKEVVPSERFQAELGRVSEVRGRAAGRLTVGESLDDLSFGVTASDVSLACSYGRIPLPLILRAGSFVYRGTTVSVSNLSGSVGRSVLTGVSGTAGWNSEPTLDISSAAGRLDLGELYPWVASLGPMQSTLRDFRPSKGLTVVDTFTLRGPLFGPAEWVFRSSGRVENAEMQSVRLPGVLRVTGAEWRAERDSTEIRNASVAVLDSSSVVSARVGGFPSRTASFDATFSGRIGPRLATWALDLAGVPQTFRPSRPAAVEGGRLSWQPGGTLSYAGEHTFEAGPTVSVAARRAGNLVAIDRLAIEDSTSNARITLDILESDYRVRFNGLLAQGTVDRFLQVNPYFRGQLEGDFEAHLNPRQPQDLSVQGWIRGGDVPLPDLGGIPARIESASIQGEGRAIRVEAARLVLGQIEADVTGRLEVVGDSIRPDLTLSAAHVDGDSLSDALLSLEEEGPASERQGRPGRWIGRIWELPVEGKIRAELGSFRYRGFDFAPLRGEAHWSQGRITVDFPALGLCGIQIPGQLEMTAAGLKAEARPRAQNVDLHRTLECLGQGMDLSGPVNFEAKAGVEGSLGKPRRLFRSMDGDFVFDARKGRIHRFALLQRILAVVNLTEILRGRLPDFSGKGLSYETLKSKGRIKEGKIIFEDSWMDASVMNVFWEGTIDLPRLEADLTVAVAPFKTLDAIVSRIPVLNYALDRTLVSIPIRVTGDLRDPKIVPLAPSAVGRSLLGLMGRTLMLPYKLIQPLLPEGAPSAPE